MAGHVDGDDVFMDLSSMVGNGDDIYGKVRAACPLDGLSLPLVCLSPLVQVPPKPTGNKQAVDKRSAAEAARARAQAAIAKVSARWRV